MDTQTITENITCVGSKIKAARKELSISYEQIADNLKITKDKVINIESDIYKNNYVDVYYRGYIRSICKMLNINSDEILEQLSTNGISTQLQPPFVNKQKPMELKKTIQIKPKSLLISIILVLFVISIFNASSSVNDNLTTNVMSKKLSLQDLSVNKTKIS